MRTFIISGILLLISGLIKADSPFFFNEFDISLNRTALLCSGSDGRSGFGLGAYHVSNGERKVNFVLGLEFNSASQFREWGDGFHFGNESDVTYVMNDFSILVGPRFSLNKDKTLFIDLNGFLDLPMRTRISGTFTSWLPDENGNYQWQSSNFTKRSNIMNLDFDPSLGFGASFKEHFHWKMSLRVGLHPTNNLTCLSKNYFRTIIGYRL